MKAWIYAFSQFTDELLLFEALFIFILFALYSGYWILKKRRYGSVKEVVPAAVVKTYLNELILDAESIRSQLFGLLEKSDLTPEQITALMNSKQRSAPALTVTAASMPAAAPSAAPAADPRAQENIKKLTEAQTQLSSKINDQEKVILSLSTEKKKLEEEIINIRKKASDMPAASGDASDLLEMKKRIEELEAKLAEYSIIEDDLANLKRLQQENTQLKAALAQGGGAPPAGATANPAPAPAEQKPAAPEPAIAAAAPVQEAPKEKPKAPEPPLADLSAAVSQSLNQPSAAPEAPAVAAAPPAAEGVKSDEDLLSEFEKMLNS